MKSPKWLTLAALLLVMAAACFVALSENEFSFSKDVPAGAIASPSIAATEIAGLSEPLSAAPDAWTLRLIEARTADASRTDRSAIQAFNQWAIAFAAGDPAARDAARALTLAPIRRAALKELIKEDAAAAWKAMLPREVRASLPASFQPFLEESITQSGDWEVYAACNWEAPQNSDGLDLAAGKVERPSIFQEAVFEDRRYHAFPVGLLSSSTSHKAIALQGFAIDETAVFNGVPDGRIENGGMIPSDTNLQTRDPQSGGLVVDEASIRTQNQIPPSAIAFARGGVIQFFDSEDSLLQFQAGFGSGSAGTGEDVILLAAPLASVGGQPDSLPLFGREGGTLTGSQSLGYRTLLYMRIAFADDPNEVVQSEANIYADLRNANDNILETSYGRMQILPTVTPVIVLPEPQSYYASRSTSVLAADARAAASLIGYSPDDYGHRVYRYSGAPGSFGGLAAIGSVPGDIWLRGGSASLLVHEIGHNLSLFHSNGWVTESKASIGPSSSLEYDHNYCIMADGYDFSRAGFNSYQKSRIGWLRDSEYITSQVSGRHRIHAIDDPQVDPDKRYAIRIPTPNRGNYWLEYRNNYTNSAFRNGLLLQAQGPGWTNNTSLPNRIDVTYWSKNGASDSPIPIGWTFSDHEQGVHVTPITRADDFSWIDVQVHHEQDFTGNSAPTATLTASDTNPAPGASVSFSLTNVSDPDGDELRYYWYFDDEVYQNSSWSTLTARNRSWSEPGVYNVIAVVTDMKGGTCFKTIPVTVGTPSDFSISGQAVDHAGNGVAGVAVDNGVGFSAADYRATLTDEDGNYTLGRLPAAGYTVSARKDFDSYAGRGFTNPVSVGPSALGVDFRARVLQVEAVGAPVEGGASGQFTISRVQSVFDFSGDIFFRVSYSGDAEAGVDYTITPAPVNDLYSLTGGADTLTLTVTPINDAAEEGPEDVTLSLAMGTGLALVDTATTKATLLIGDNESAHPRVRAIPMARYMDENGGTADVLFIRYGDTTNALTVNIGTDSNVGLATYDEDYAFDTGSTSIVIPAGSETAVLQVIALDDALLEGFEKTQFRINNGVGYVRDRDPSNILIDIADDEIPTVSVTTADGFAGEGNNGLGYIRFTRDPVGATPLVINYGVRDISLHGTDYTQLSGVATIPANAASIDVAIEGLPDALIEGSEGVTLRASSSDSSDYVLVSDALEASVSLNDKPILTMTGPPSSFSELSPQSGQFTINRVGPTAALTITIESIGTADGGSDFTYPATVELPAEGASVSFTVTPLTDSIPEGEEIVTLNIVPQVEYGVDVSPAASQTIEDLPVDDWRFAVFGVDATDPEIAGDDADPDGDRQANLLEFATLSEPLVANVPDLKPNVDSNVFTIEYKRRKNSAVNVQSLWTEKLNAPGSWSPIGVTEEVIEDTPEYTLIRASIPVTSNPGFLKIEVSR